MTPERHQRISELFHRVLELDEAERDDFLRRACAGDEELRHEVESLLTAHRAAGSFIASPAIDGHGGTGTGASVERVSSGTPPGPIGPYRIVGLLGRGGMGEVYRAHDARLGRDVAIKILPDELARDAERRNRFEREARILAALNHPHIASLYGIEDAGSHHALVMELIEGETLADRIAAGPLPVSEALSLATQVADALEAAHDQGIVHRDLKPGNITVRRDSTVKVLDFGLAKALEPAGSEDTQRGAPLTDTRAIVGTAMYMSPEQARGGVVDRRADIWAFGCVLYEMLTGQRAFDGDSASDVIAAVLERAPDWNALPAHTPAAVRRVLRRCLEKDPRDRLRHIADARLEIRDASDLDSHDAAQGAWPAHSGRRGVLAPVAVLAGVVAAAVAGWSVGTRSASKPLITPARLSIAGLEPLLRKTYGVSHLSVSPDAFRVAYASANRLLIRRMDQKETVGIDVPAVDPFFSPDGEWVAFFDGEGARGLEKVPVHGGVPAIITAIAGRPYGGAWRADGTIVFSTSDGLYQVPASGGKATLLLKPDPTRSERAYVSPAFMPDGQSLLFTIVPEGSTDGVQIALLDLNTRAYVVVVPRGSTARYLPTGHLIYTSGQTLNAVAFDRDARRIRGEPVALTDVRVAIAADNGIADFDVSSTGTLLFIASDPPLPESSFPAWVNRSGTIEPLPIQPGSYGYPRVSPGGQFIALDVLGANRDIWIWNVQRPSLTRLTRGAGEDMLPTWSPHGRLFFSSQQNGNFDIYSQAPDGSTPARLELAAPGDQMPLGFTPDGTKLIVNENFKDVSVLSLTQPPRLDPLLHSDANEWIGEVSPDGKWIAYESDESGDGMEVFVRPFPNVDALREKVSVGGGRYPMWSREGSEMYFVDPHGAMMAVSIRLSPTLVLGRTTKLFDTDAPQRTVSGRPYDIGPDGRFLVLKSGGSGPSETVDITVVLNWAEDLKRLIP